MTAPDEQEMSASASIGVGAGAEGALEKFIRKFNAYEFEADLFKRCTDEAGFAWWDLVRYVVQFALCAEQGIYIAQQAPKKPLSARAASFVAQSARLLRDVFRLSRLRAPAIGGIYVFRRPPKSILEAIAASPLPCLVVGDRDAAWPPHVGIDKRSVDLFVRIASRFIRPSPAMIEVVSQVDSEIKARFCTGLDIHRIVVGKYVQHQAATIAWRWILARTGRVGVVGFVGDDSQKTLADMANREGIPTREFQHGYMGASHVNYSYPPLSSKLTTLPAKVVVHRDTRDITYPVTRIYARDEAVSTREEGPTEPREIDVLIGASPTRAAETLAIAEVLVNRGLVVAVKLHPNQTVASSGFRDRYTRAQLQVHANDIDFATLARRASIYVPANPTSTTVFEAVDNGARLVVVDYCGVKLTRMIDAIVSERVDSLDQLYGAVRSHLNVKAEPRDGA